MIPGHPLYHLRPDYRGGSIVNLLTSLRGALGCEGRGQDAEFVYPPLRALPAESLKQASNTVLLILDGVGYDVVSRRAGALQDHLLGPMSTVFPPTTASAITSWHTGVAPLQHTQTGWFGWYRAFGAVLAILPINTRLGWVPMDGKDMPVENLFPAPSYLHGLKAECHAVLPSFIQNSTYTRLHLGPAKRHGVDNMNEVFTRIADLAGQAKGRFIYGYWHGYDAQSHQMGVGSEAVAEHYQGIDEAFGQMVEKLQGTGTQVLVSADHGFVDTRPEELMHLDDHRDLEAMLRLPLCGEPRAAYAYVRPGAVEEFHAGIKERFGDRLEVFPSEAIVEAGWFGLGEAHGDFHERIGDYTLIPTGTGIIKDRLPGEGPFKMIGVHGGVSEAELTVPLIHVAAS